MGVFTTIVNNGPNGSDDSSFTIGVAGEHINQGDICYYNSDSKWYKSTSTDINKCSSELRIAYENILINLSGQLLRTGDINMSQTLIVGNSYYLGETPGTITDTPSNNLSYYHRYVGTARSSSILIFNPSATYIDIGATSVNNILLNTYPNNYLELPDTPSSRVGQANKIVSVNFGETAEEYRNLNAIDILDFDAEVNNNTTVTTNKNNADASKIKTDLLTITQAVDLDQIELDVTNSNNHILNISNPHSITKTQIGLSNIDNTSDLNKPISIATQSAIDLKVNTALLGANNGVAELDATGFVKNTQLPSYVDDVLEFANLASFPVTGDAGKIYIATDTNKNISLEWFCLCNHF